MTIGDIRAANPGGGAGEGRTVPINIQNIRYSNTLRRESIYAEPEIIGV